MFTYISLLICVTCLSVGHSFVLTGGRESSNPRSEHVGTHPQQIYAPRNTGYQQLLQAVPSSELRYDYNYNAEKRQLLLLLPFFDSSSSAAGKDEDPTSSEVARIARAPPLPRLGRVMKRDGGLRDGGLSILDGYVNDYDVTELDVNRQRSKRSLDSPSEDTRGKSWFLPRLGAKRQTDNTGLKSDRSSSTISESNEMGKQPMTSMRTMKQRAVPVPRMGRSQGSDPKHDESMDTQQ